MTMQSPARASSMARPSLSLSGTGIVRRQAGIGVSAGDSLGMVGTGRLTGPPFVELATGALPPEGLPCGPPAAGGGWAMRPPPQPASNHIAIVKSKRRQRRLGDFGFLVIGPNIPRRTHASERKSRASVGQRA